MLTLALETSTTACGVALGGPELTAIVLEDTRTRRHAEVLTPLVRDACRQAGVGLAELDRIVVDLGPGGFTGLRVGLASARALGWASGTPVLGLTSLELLREPCDTTFVSVLDAGTGLFWAAWGARPLEPAWGRADELVALLAGTPCVLGGTGAGELAEALGGTARVAHEREPSAAMLLERADDAVEARELHYLRPHYAAKKTK